MNSYPGVLHRYAPRLVAFEFHSESKSPDLPEKDVSTLIFVGGLFDDLLTVPFLDDVFSALSAGWRVMQVALSSSGIGWGTCNLDMDISEIGKCVAYVRDLRPGGKIVLMGHSTGSQDTLHYLSSSEKGGYGGEDRPRLDGAILQAAVSDREGIEYHVGGKLEVLEQSVALAKKMVSEGKRDGLLPRDMLAAMPPITASRWLSIASPGPEHDGQDDMFSSDLSDDRLEKTFGAAGRTKTPFMILGMGSDQYVPDHSVYSDLVNRWISIVKNNKGPIHALSGIVPGMDHTGSGADLQARSEFVKRVNSFLESL